MRKWSPFGKRRSSRTATATSTQVRRNAFTTLLGGSLATKAQAPASWSVGDRVLDLYEVTDVHREGGMGVVYRVRHLAWNTDLAVKSPRAKLFRDDADRERFTREAETWISLGLHPHVCSCHYVRTLGGVPRVFAEYVEGGSLRDWIRDGRLYAGGDDETLARILDIAIQIAWGLDHAHSHGVVHQDVKPANILLDHDATAKVTDFGLARARPVQASGTTEGSLFSGDGGMTPAYASPEQATQRKVGRQTDIWSFAVSVLEMFAGEVTWLAGQAAGAALADLRAWGGSRVPLPHPVADLLAHCLREEPRERPARMAHVAAHLRSLYRQQTGHDHPRETPAVVNLQADELNNRGLSLLDLGRPTDAETALEQARSVDPQHPEASYNLGLLRWRAGRLTDDRFVKELEGVHTSTAGSRRAQILLAQVHLERGDVDAVDSLLPPAKPGQIDSEVWEVADLARSDEVLAARPSHVFDIARWAVACLSNDGRYVVSGDGDGVIRFHDADAGTCMRQWAGHDSTVQDVCLSADGALLLSGGMDIVGWKWRHTLKLWDTRSSQCLRALVSDTSIDSASLSADGRSVLFGCGDEMVRLWQPRTDRVDIVGGPSRPEALYNEVAHHAVWLSADAKLALSGGFVGTVLRLWDVRTGRCVREFEGHDNVIASVHLSTDGALAVSGSADRTVRLWDVATGRCLRVFDGHSGDVDSVWLSADRKFIVSGSMDHTVRLWDAESGRCLRTFHDHTSNVRSVRLSTNGRQLVSGAGDATVRRWQLTDRAGYLCPLSLCRPRAQAELTRLNRQATALVAEAENAMTAGRPRDALHALSSARALPGHERSPRILAAWRRLALTATPTGLAAIWQAGTYTEHDETIDAVFVTPDGRLAASVDWEGTAHVWEVPTRHRLHTFPAKGRLRRIALSPDGNRLLLGNPDGLFEIYETSTGRLLNSFPGEEAPNELCLSADGELALSSSLREHKVRLWDLRTGKCLRTIDGPNGVHAVAFTPNARLGLVANGHHTVQIWDLADGDCIQTLTGHQSDATATAVSADGRRVLTGSMDHTVRVWDLHTGHSLRTLTGHQDHVSAVAFSTDGRIALSAAWDAQVRLWDLESGQCARVLSAHHDRLFTACLSADGRFALSGGGDRTIHVWELDRDLAVHDPADWDEGARPHLEAFLQIHRRAAWSDNDFQDLLRHLAYAGYGWLRPSGVKAQLQ